MSKRHYLVVGAVMVLAILAGLFGGLMQGRTAAQSALDMEQVINEYVAQPLLEARDELRAKFDEEASLEDGWKS